MCLKIAKRELRLPFGFRAIGMTSICNTSNKVCTSSHTMKAKFYKFIAYSLHYFKFYSISFQYDNIGCCLINSFNGIQARCDFQLVKSTRCFNRRYDNQQLVWNKSEKEKTVKKGPVIRFLWVSTLFTELHLFQHEGVVLKVHLSTYDDTSPINTITIENLFACSHDTDNVVVFCRERTGNSKPTIPQEAGPGGSWV